MIRFFKDDSETLEAIVMALETFESYHQAIYQLEITRMLNGHGALDGSDYREQFLSRDATRTRNHDALLAQVNIPDGDQIRVFDSDGNSRDLTCRYIDDYHLEVAAISSNLYHITEFASAWNATAAP